MSGPIVLGLRLILAVALYGFLGWALWTIWQDLQQQGLGAATRKIPAISLQVWTRIEPSIARRFSQPELFIGRDPSCDIPLDDETVSARHAKLSYHHGQWWVEDLNSSNGTLLNREKLTTAAVLTSGDEIECGQARLGIELDLLS